MDIDDQLKAEPVTAVILRSVKPGCMEEFEMWASGMTQIACNFPGFLGTHAIRPRDIFHPEYVIVVQFDNVNHLKIFMTSTERAEYLKKSEMMTVDEMSIQEIHGFESFFSLPDHSERSPAPARYKMAVLTILALYPLLLLFSTLFASIFHGLPRPLLILFTLIVLIPIMTYFIMPWTTRLFRFWLYPVKSSD
jgi:antibiotic biosynthesis monooxygenase (ABM) superfamily enzyme